jgi:cell division protein ZapA
MSNVNLEIGGRSYAVACENGQESHVLRLGRAIDTRLSTMPSAAGQSEARMLLFAALLMADECHELSQGRAPSSTGDENGEALESIAGRLENCAALLEGEAPSA